jgi:ribosomal protein L7/L12
VPEEVLAKIRTGDKVEAIKLYREMTGKGLKESHELVEEIDRRIRFRL